MVTQWEYDFDTDTVVFYLQDTIALTDSLRVDAGFRAVNSENTIAPWSEPEERQHRDRRTIPSAGRYQLGAHY